MNAKHKAATLYCFRLLLKITYCHFSTNSMNAQLTDKKESFFGPLKNNIKNEGAVCKIIRYRSARLIWFAGSKVVYVGEGISALVQRIFNPSNRNNVPVNWFFSSECSVTTTSMLTARPNVDLVCVPPTSVTNSQISFLKPCSSVDWTLEPEQWPSPHTHSKTF
jgi:hypothetical protein